MSATVTKGGLTAGNSSVLSRARAKIPKTTSVSIATTVITGRRMAESEMIMGGIARPERTDGPGCRAVVRGPTREIS